MATASSPTDMIDFNLDEVVREKTYKPFVFTYKDRTISLSDPAELDYKDLLEVENPIGFLRYVATPEDREFIRNADIEGWRLGKLMEAYYRHFGMDKERQKLGF